MQICFCRGWNQKDIDQMIQDGRLTAETIKDFPVGCCGHCQDDLLKSLENIPEDKYLEQVKKITDQIKFRDWVLRVERDNLIPNGRVFLQWIYWDYCSKTGEWREWHSRKWYLSPYMMESEIVKTAFGAVLLANDHEVREHFKYQEIRIFNPHRSLETMMALASEDEVRKPEGEEI